MKSLSAQNFIEAANTCAVAIGWTQQLDLMHWRFFHDNFNNQALNNPIVNIGDDYTEFVLLALCFCAAIIQAGDTLS